MAKKKKDVERTPKVGVAPKELKRQLLKLGRGLETAQKLEAKRTRQLDKVRLRGEAYQASILALQGPASQPAEGGPQAYCMRERRTVVVTDPVAIVMRNGRGGVSGTCASCGAKVVTMARKAVALGEGDGVPSPEA